MYSITMPETEHFTFMLPPNAWSKKPYQSTFKMTREEAAQRYPGAEPILSSREVRRPLGEMTGRPWSGLHPTVGD